MKIIENVTMYQCEHCKRKMVRKGDMTRHEKNCKKNPLNEDACIGCKFCEKEEVIYPSIYQDDWGYSPEVKSYAFKCTKFNKLMYPHKAQKYAEKHPHTFHGQEVMPNECGGFEFDFMEF